MEGTLVSLQLELASTSSEQYVDHESGGGGKTNQLESTARSESQLHVIESVYGQTDVFFSITLYDRIGQVMHTYPTLMKIVKMYVY